MMELRSKLGPIPADAIDGEVIPRNSDAAYGSAFHHWKKQFLARNNARITKGSPDQPRNAKGEWTSGGGDLSDDEKNNVEEYQADGFIMMNQMLLGDKPYEDDDQKAILDDQIKLMDSAMSKSMLDKSRTVYRAMPMTDMDLAKLKTGDVVTMKNFVSTSKSWDAVNGFIEQMGVIDRDKWAVMKISAPGGTHAVDVNPVLGGTVHDAEQEVILDRGMSYYVSGTGTKDGIRTIDMKVEI